MLTVRVTPCDPSGSTGYVARVYRVPSDPPEEWAVASWGQTPFEALHRAKANYEPGTVFDVILPTKNRGSSFPRRSAPGQGVRR